ncbi:14885_t:CDS:2, partial [Entrophospora sp. SA101]
WYLWVALFVEGFTLKEIKIRRAEKIPVKSQENLSQHSANNFCSPSNYDMPKTYAFVQLETKQITDREAIEQHLIKKLGKPTTEIQSNLLSELTKKINSYYLTSEETQNYTTYSLFGSVSEIQEKKFKEGKNKGRIYYVLKLGGGNSKETLQARKEDLPPEK